jgi:hypothetical protein
VPLSLWVKVIRILNAESQTPSDRVRRKRKRFVVLPLLTLGIVAAVCLLVVRPNASHIPVVLISMTNTADGHKSAAFKITNIHRRSVQYSFAPEC